MIRQVGRPRQFGGDACDQMLLAIIEQSTRHLATRGDCRERAADGCECAELPERA